MRELRDALLAFVDCIEATGGVFGAPNSKGQMIGLFAPLADPDWTDLGSAYLKACTALVREPVIALSEEDEDYEEEDADE